MLHFKSILYVNIITFVFSSTSFAKKKHLKSISLRNTREINDDRIEIKKTFKTFHNLHNQIHFTFI